MSGLKAWSFSRWRKYDTCPRSAKYAYIDRLPDPPGPAMARGQAVHEALEKYLKGEADHVPPEGLNLKQELMSLKKAPGLRVEDQWAFRGDWSECGWFAKGCWLRCKVDARYGLRDAGMLTIVDFKTGCKPPMEPSKYDDLQKELYAVAAYSKFKDHLDVVVVEYWYLDRPSDDNIYRRVFEKDELAGLQTYWHEVGVHMCADDEFEKRPGFYCRWCPFRDDKGGPCDGREEDATDGAF